MKKDEEPFIIDWSYFLNEDEVLSEKTSLVSTISKEIRIESGLVGKQFEIRILSGGTVGEVYEIENRIVSSEARVATAIIKIKCEKTFVLLGENMKYPQDDKGIVIANRLEYRPHTIERGLTYNTSKKLNQGLLDFISRAIVGILSRIWGK